MEIYIIKAHGEEYEYIIIRMFYAGRNLSVEEQILSDWLHSQEAKEQLSNYYQETWKGSNNKLIAEVQCPLFKTA